MGNSVLKVFLWLTRSGHQLFKYSQGFGVWLHSCWFWWRLKCFQSCYCWEHLSSLSKCQSGMRCFPWDHSLSQTKAAGIELWGTAENPCAALATGNGCCCILQISPPLPERISAAALAAVKISLCSCRDKVWQSCPGWAAAAMPQHCRSSAHTDFPCSPSLCPRGNLALSVLGEQLWQVGRGAGEPQLTWGLKRCHCRLRASAIL